MLSLVITGLKPGVNESRLPDFDTKPIDSSACESHRTVEIRRSPALRATCLRIVGFIHSFSTDSVETDLAVTKLSARGVAGGPANETQT